MCTTTPAGALRGATAAALPAPESPCGMQPPPRNGAPWDADRDGGSDSPGFACKRRKTRPATTGAVPLFSGFRRPRFLRVRSRYRHSCPGGTRLPYPPRHHPLPHSDLRPARAAPRSSEHAGSNPSPSITRAPPLAPGSGRHSLSGPSTPGSITSAAKAAAPMPPPARPGPCPSPASPPAAPPPPHVTRPRRGFR